MGSFGLGHWLVVLVIVLLLFGAGRLSDIGKGLGEGIKNFKKGLADDEPQPGTRVKEVAELEGAAEPKQLAAEATVAKKKRVIQVEVDDDADEAEVARKIAETKKAAAKSDG